MRSARLACGAALLLAIVVAAVAAAQTSVPGVAVSVSKSAVTVTPAAPIAPGPTRFTFTRSGNGEVEGFLATLRAGVTVDELRQKLSSESSLGLVFLEASVSLNDQAPTRSLTVDLRPDVTYVVVAIAGNANTLTSFTTTGTANGAQAPKPDAQISMVDYGFRGPKTLPRDGTIRVANRGLAYHFALAFPVRKGASRKRIGRAFRNGDEKAIGRIVAGQPLEVQDLISPGSVNDNEVEFQRPGRYAFVCFFGAHNRLGMYRVFNVR